MKLIQTTWKLQCLFIIYLTLQLSAEGLCRTLGPTACLKMLSKKHVWKSGRKEKNPWLHLDSLEPTAISSDLRSNTYSLECGNVQ